jgi:hypothetical protein
MAQMTPEEIQGIFEAYNDAIKTGAPVTKELADAMKDAQKGIKGYAAAQANAVKALGTAVSDTVKQLYRGEQGAKGMADSVETVTTALTTLSFLVGGPLIKAISLITMGLFKFGKVAAEQSDQLFKTYQDLAKIGAGGAEGMKGVFDNMQKFGYGLEELDKMTSLIKENSQALSTFGGTVLSGAKGFSDAMAPIQRGDVGRRLQQMGYTVDDINKYGAGYIKQQQMLGLSQATIQKNLTQGTVQYTMELDKLARITGDTREAQEAKIQEAMAEDTFAATMDELREQAAAGDASAEARLKKLNILNQTLTGEARQEFIKAIGGDVSAAQKLMMTAPNAYRQMLDASSSAGDVMSTLNKESKETGKAMRGLYQLGAAGDTFLRYNEIQTRAAKFGDKNLDEQMAMAEAEQTVTNQATKDAADMRISQQQARDSLQSFVNIGVNPATAALNKLSGAAAGATRILPGTPGGPTGQRMGGGGPASLNSALEGFNKPAQQPTGPVKPATGTQKEFLDSMYKNLLDEAKKQGVKNPEVIAKLGTAQSALETGYGKHTAGGNNYFGIKARPGEGGSGVATQEFINGKMVTVNDKFRKYGSMQESAADYVKFLQENKRYKGVLGAGTLDEAIAAQSKTGYATDPMYGSKLSGIAGKIGPTQQYQASKIDPVTAMAKDSAAASASTSNTSTSDDQMSIWSRISDTLDQLNRNSRDQVDVSKKIYQASA